MTFKRVRTVYIYCILTIIFIGILIKGYIYITQNNHWIGSPQAHKGVIRLDDEVLEKHDTISLNGEWEFYPNVFLNPNEIKTYQGDRGELFVPSVWAGKEFGEMKMGANGYGTYQLKLINTGEPKKIMLYFLSAPAEAYKLYVNNEQVFEIGEVAKNQKNSNPEYQTKRVECDLNQELVLTIQVSNFLFDMGGYHKPIILGKPENIQNLRDFNFAKDIFTFGILMMFLLYFSLIWMKNRHNGYAIACFIYASIISIMYVVSSNEMLIHIFFPRISFRIHDIMYYMLATSGGCIYILLINHLYCEESNEKIKWISVIKTVIVIFINITFQRQFVCKMTMFFGIVTILEFLYGIFVLSKATASKKEGTIPILFGTTVLMSAIIYDILYSYVVVISPYGLITPLALAVFILSFAVVVARQYEQSFQEVTNLSQRLIEMDKIKDQFLANTSHELRTPINSMIALTKSLLEQDESFRESEKESLNMVVSSGRRLSNLINDLLDYSSMQHGQINLVESYFDIKAIIENTIKEIKPSVEHKEIRLNYEIQEGISKVYADKYRLIQVIYNVIGNAIKFTPEKGMINIKVEEKSNKIFINIEDTGIGIEEEKIKTIFQSFVQADQKVSKKYGGLGLGLSISKEIMISHQGDILVESELGKGSVFTIVLPIKEIEAAENLLDDEEEKLEIINERIEKETYLYIAGKSEDTIVIIDDYYSNIFAAASILKTEGYSIKGYVDVKEGLNEIINNPKVVLAIVDLMMPEVSGDEVCKEIRQRYTLLELPILILTARMQMSSLVKTFEAGANDFLHKPFEAEELRARVATLASLKKTEEKAIENELSKLQAQINPHFLCNAMVAIAECCYDDGEKAANIVMDLADYLRFSFTFDYKNKEISLIKEIELVKVYLAIEKIRFGDELNYEFDFKDEKQIMIPPFSLQTLVENAVRHGIRQKEEEGKITIKGYKEGSHYIIKIIDTGIGMTEEDIELVLLGKKSTGTGIGIANIKQRLKSIYGTELKIESVYEKGTTVTIVLGGV